VHPRACLIVLITFVVGGCGIPRDAAGTLRSVRGGVLRVGISANRPWVIDRGQAVDGVEGRLASTIGSSVGATIEWVRLPESELVRALHDREIQLGVGGFDAASPWAEEVAFTRPYLTEGDGKSHVLAAPPGENAWLLLLDRQIQQHKSAVPALLAEFR
jgi:polar amino acid transport system substrate-binding protein